MNFDYKNGDHHKKIKKKNKNKYLKKKMEKAQEYCNCCIINDFDHIVQLLFE